MIKREAAIFLIVGSLTVLIDFLSYRGLVFYGLETSPAKASGFLIGTIFAYFANRHWTFAHKNHKKGSAWRFAGLYATTLTANVGVNKMILHFLTGFSFSVQIAFLFATGVSTILNFLGMKFFVFKETK
ncbi:MAG: GtrA family protein [Pseudomonadota bacterium]